jgi:hypothetical protein
MVLKNENDDDDDDDGYNDHMMIMTMATLWRVQFYV